MMEDTFERSIEFDLWCFDLGNELYCYPTIELFNLKTMEMNYIVIQICFH